MSAKKQKHDRVYESLFAKVIQLILADCKALGPEKGLAAFRAVLHLLADALQPRYQDIFVNSIELTVYAEEDWTIEVLNDMEEEAEDEG